MGKVKSAIITAIVITCLVCATFFAVISVPYKAVKLNSVLSSISLSSELTGYAETIIYPEGVISKSEYQVRCVAPDEEDDNYDEWEDAWSHYEALGNYYYDASTYKTEADIAELKATVESDAKVINTRLSKIGYTSYSVTVLDSLAIKIAVPTTYSYADFADEGYSNQEESASTKISNIATILGYLVYDGNLTLRNTAFGKNYDDDIGNYSLFRNTVDVGAYISSVSTYSYAGTYAIKFNLTDDGEDAIASITNQIVDSDDTTMLFYIGSNELMSLTIESQIDNSYFYITVSSETLAKAYAAILNTVISGNAVELNYNSENTTGISLSATETDNKYAALVVAIMLLLILVALSAISVKMYKKLGWTNIIIIVMYALVMIYAPFFLSLEIGVASILCAVVGLALLMATNYMNFESVREEVAHGNVMKNAIIRGYKANIGKNIDIHLVLIVLSLAIYFAGVATISTCGLMMFIATIASYTLSWFTRFMWYVLSSQERNKFAFCGFKREVIDDED